MNHKNESDDKYALAYLQSVYIQLSAIFNHAVNGRNILTVGASRRATTGQLL
ncbi:hypothetical protein OBV_04480 [Oscillibacter valericigenes Sjm18-20]|nr:hypothetical protein OBV_04480 [Oscillibacter valericigenes Sjm18-20]